MYVTPDIFGVEIEIFGAVAQPLDATIATLAQWRSGGRLWRIKKEIPGVPVV